MEQHAEMGADGRSIDLDLLGYRAFIAEIEEEKATWRAKSGNAEHEGRRICDFLDDLAHGGVPPLHPIYGSAFYVGANEEAYQDVFLDREPVNDIARLRLPSWPGVSSDLHRAIVRAIGIPRLYVVDGGGIDPRSDGVLVAMCVTDILDPLSNPVVVTCPEAYEEAEGRWKRVMLL